MKYLFARLAAIRCFWVLIVLFNVQLNAAVLHIQTVEELQSLIASGKQVMIKFYSDTCPPCNQYKPIFEQVSNDAQFQNIIFVAISIKKFQKIAQKYGVTALPTTLFMVNGTIKGRSAGLQNVNQLKKFIENASR